MSLKRRIVFICPYPTNTAPSQRFRFEQYFPFLESENTEIKTASFLDKKTWELLYEKGRYLLKAIRITACFFRRISLLFALRKTDIIFIHRESAPAGPPVFEWLLSKVFRRKYTFDFDDAIWLPNYSSANAKFQRLKWYGKTSKIIRWASDVTAGNEFLANYARQLNKNVRIVPTTIDTGNRHNQFADHDQEPVIIGWTGTHSTMRYLDFIVPVIQKLEREFDFEFHIISNQRPDYPLRSLRYKDWSLENEISDLAQFQIGIMPLVSDEWSEGKCGFKALQYMSLGMAAIVSPVGVNVQIVQHGENGFIAESAEEWESALRLLLEDPELRKSIGQQARKSIEEKWSVAAWKSAYLKLIEKH